MNASPLDTVSGPTGLVFYRNRDFVAKATSDKQFLGPLSEDGLKGVMRGRSAVHE